MEQQKVNKYPLLLLFGLSLKNLAYAWSNPKSTKTPNRLEYLLKMLIFPWTSGVNRRVDIGAVKKLNPNEISYEDLKAIASERSTGGFGSSGK